MCVRQFNAAQRGTYFAETSVRARAKIADLGAPFIRPGARVLTHGNSRVVLALLRRAVAQVPCSEPLCCIITEYLNNPVARCSGRGLVGAFATPS